MSRPIPVPAPTGARPIPMQRPPKGPGVGALSKTHVPAAPVIGSLPAPRFSLDMPEINLPPASLEASSLTIAPPPPAVPAPRGVMSSSAPAVSFMGKAAAARPSAGLLSSSPTVLGLLQTRGGGAPMHAGQARTPGVGDGAPPAGDAALTAALRGFSLSSAASDPFAKAAVADASPRPAAEGGLAAALQRQAVAPAAGPAAAAAASSGPPKSAAPVLLSASFRDRPAFLVPAIAEGGEDEEERQDAALDSSDDEAAGRGRRGAAPAAAPAVSSRVAGGRAAARTDSALSEEEEEDDDDGGGGGGAMRDEAAEELQL